MKRRDRIEPVPEPPPRRHRFLRRWAQALADTRVDDVWLLENKDDWL